MKNIKLRNTTITIFVILWTLLFHYESTRYFYLNPWTQKNMNISLPKTKLLFPPAGWIMFYSVGNTSGHRDVYGIKNGKSQYIDPHEIIRTRTILYDNIHRGVLSSIAARRNGHQFCQFLKRRLPYFDDFMVTANYYPHIDQERFERREQIEYRCGF